MPVVIQDREFFFTENFRILVKKYKIRTSTSKPSHQDCQRFGYLCSILIAKMYDVKLMSDAFCWFYNLGWARSIRCNRIDEEKYDKEGNFVSGPWSNTFKRFFENVSFQKYNEYVDFVLTPERDPIVKREPVIHADYKNGMLNYGLYKL